MPRNGSGSFSLAQSPFVAGTTISSAAMNSDLSDIASALTGSLPRDGQAGMTGQLKLPDGNSSAPGFSFSNETNTGFTRVSTGVIGITILGVQVGTIAANGVTGSVPVGTVIDYAGFGAGPVGWLFCFGQAVSRTTFAALFAIIGGTYGNGDGSTTFNLPDCRNYVTVGRGDMGGSDAGRLTSAFYGGNPLSLGSPGGGQSRSLITANLPSHTHGVTGSTGNDSPDHSHPETAFMTSSGITAPSSGGPAFIGSNLAGQSTGGASTRHTHSIAVTSDGGSGSATSFATIQPSIVMNKIIYTGG